MSPPHQKVLLIAGFDDIKMAGNLVVTKTVYYLLKNNFLVTVVSALPENYYQNISVKKKVFSEFANQYRVIYLPKLFEKIFYFFRFFKDLFKSKKIYSKENQNHHSLRPREYFSDLNLIAQFVYFLGWLGHLFFGLIWIFLISLKEKPILFYGYDIYGAPVASILGKIFRKPVVTRFPGTVLNLKEKKMWYKYFPHHVFGLKSPADAVIMGNDGTRGNEVLKLLGASEDKIHFWMDGFDKELLKINQDKIKEIKIKYNLSGKKIILSTTIPRGFKRVDRIIYTLKELQKKYNFKNVRLLIVGKGPEEVNLKNLTKFYQISDLVIFVGTITHKDLGNYYSLADVFMITNDVSNLGNPLLEALCFGLPIVTLKDGSTNELLSDNYNALLVPIEEMEERLPKAVYKILTDSELARKLRRRAKITAKEKILSWEERMEKEIKELKIKK